MENPYKLLVDHIIDIMVIREKIDSKLIYEENRKINRKYSFTIGDGFTGETVISRGLSVMDAGYVYAPYIPLQMTPIVYENGMGKTKKVGKRYDKNVKGDYYGRVRI